MANNLYISKNKVDKSSKSIIDIFSKIKQYYTLKINKIRRDDKYSFRNLKTSINKKWYKNIINIKMFIFFILFLLDIIFRFAIELILVSFVFLLIIYLSVNIYTSKYIYTNLDDIKANEVGVVLGTSKYTKDNEINKYYLYRIEAAYDLYISGKIKYLLVSGDNRSHRYNEPQKMFNDLSEMGIPKDKIYLDYAGFRTYDSMVRAKEVFGQTSFTVISQKFHNERAIFIGRAKGLNVIGFNAKNVNTAQTILQFKREILSRVLMYFDIIIGRHPHFYGEPVNIGSE